MNFLQYKTAKELYDKTGLSTKQALRLIDAELDEIRKKRGDTKISMNLLKKME